MAELDNTGDSNRWEDPRDIINGATDREEWHNCHFCGESVKGGYDPTGKRHWLSDCRPDLVEHEPGPICTWHGLTDLREAPQDCYAFQSHGDKSTGYKPVWTDEHIHFYPDGPM